MFHSLRLILLTSNFALTVVISCHRKQSNRAKVVAFTIERGKSDSGSLFPLPRAGKNNYYFPVISFFRSWSSQTYMGQQD